MTGAAPGPPARVSLRLVGYNVHGLRGDRTALVELLRSLEPDLVVLQEGPRRLRWRTRCATLADQLGLCYAVGGAPALGNLILAGLRVRVHDARCVRFPLTPGRHMRGAALARCSVAGVPFLVAGTHLATDPDERPGQASILASILSEVEVPAVLAADINDTSGSAAWRTLADGRIDVAVATGQADTPTHPAVAGQRRIDAILADPEFGVGEYRVVNTGPARRASDHLPLVADLVLPARPGRGWTNHPAAPKMRSRDR